MQLGAGMERTIHDTARRMELTAPSRKKVCCGCGSHGAVSAVGVKGPDSKGRLVDVVTVKTSTCCLKL